jgi:hypothetical protein
LAQLVEDMLKVHLANPVDKSTLKKLEIFVLKLKKVSPPKHALYLKMNWIGSRVYFLRKMTQKKTI